MDSKIIDWNGDGEGYLVPSFVTGERKSYASLDDKLKRNRDYKLPPWFVSKAVFYFANRYIDTIREE